MAKAFKLVDHWSRRELDRPWLWISGPGGVGKTMLAALGLRAFKAGEVGGRFVNFADSLSEIRSSFETESDESEFSIVDSMRSAFGLVLDDVGVEKPSEWTARILYAVINARYNASTEGHERWTIFTSNYSADAMFARLAPFEDQTAAVRILRRIAEKSYEVKL